MPKLLQLGDNYKWKLDGLEFAIEERIGTPENFIGRVEELEFLYKWTEYVQRLLGRGVAFLGRRKVGKSLILERLYNILYSEQKGLIPFYYEFTEGERSGKEFMHDFVTRFYMQLVGYYTRDISWNRQAVDKRNKPVLENVMQKIERLEFKHQSLILRDLEDCRRTLQTEHPLYEYVISALATPHGYATTPGVKDKIVQMIDEFQYLNMYIDAGVEKKPCKAYMSTAESKVAPLLITGSLMGVVAYDLMRYLPMRFGYNIVPKMKGAEARAMTLNYGELYGHAITPEIAEYIVAVTNGVPGRIVELLSPKMGKPTISTLDDVDKALEFEVSPFGTIKKDWDEYLMLAMDEVNDVHLRRITYFLCRNEGTWYYPRDLKAAMGLDIDDQALRKELELLNMYDIVEVDGGRYGGAFDRTLKKVLMKCYGDLFDLPMDEFDSYFKNDNMLDYLKERVEQLELSLAEARELQKKLAKLQGEHNHLKGHYFEQEILLRLMKAIIDDDGGLVADIRVTDFTLNYHLVTGEEIDIVLEGKKVVVMVECKNYSTENLDKLTTDMVDKFMDKAQRLHQAHFADKELRLAFFNKHGLEKSLESYLTGRGIRFAW